MKIQKAKKNHVERQVVERKKKQNSRHVQQFRLATFRLGQFRLENLHLSHSYHQEWRKRSMMIKMEVKSMQSSESNKSQYES